MKKRITVLTLAIIMGVATCCVAQNRKTESHILDIKSADPNIRYRAMYEVHKSGKQMIPQLISSIDLNEKEWIFNLDPHDSNIPAFPYDYVGILYAYTIELIIGRDHIDEKELRVSRRYSQFSLYRCGTVKRTDGEVLHIEDLRHIKSVYQAWWKKNEHKSIEQIRKDWSKGHRPLINSGYYWF